MAAAAPIAFSRKPAPLETAWMFCRGRHLLGCAYLILSFGWIGLMFASSGFIYLAVTSVTLIPMLAISAAIIDARAAERLAFASLLPRAGSAKWLVLGPMCAAGTLLVAASVVVARRPPLLGLAMLGCCFWAVSIGRWLSRRWWALVAVPALLAGPYATLFALRSGGMGAAAAVSTALAALGLVLSPGVRRVAGRARPVVGTDGRVGLQAAVSTTGLQQSASASVLRLWWIGVVNVKRWLLVSGLLVIPLALPFSLWMMWAQGFLILGLVASMALGQASKPAKQEFLCALPITRRRLFAGNVLPWLLPALIIPAALVVRLQLQSPHGDGGLAGYLSDAGRFKDPFLHGLVPALPDSWPRGGFPIEHWPAVVAALRDQLVRAALFGLVVLFAWSAASWVSDRKPARAPRWSVYLLLPVAWAGAAPAWMRHPQPLWFLSLLAADVALVFFLSWGLSPCPTVAKRGRP